MKTKCEAFALLTKILRGRLEKQISRKKATVIQSKVSEISSRDTLTVSSRRMKRPGRRKRRPRLQKHPKCIGQESESTSHRNLFQGIARLPNRDDVNYLNSLMKFS